MFFLSWQIFLNTSIQIFLYFMFWNGYFSGYFSGCAVPVATVKLFRAYVMFACACVWHHTCCCHCLAWCEEPEHHSRWLLDALREWLLLILSSCHCNYVAHATSTQTAFFLCDMMQAQAFLSSAAIFKQECSKWPGRVLFLISCLSKMISNLICSIIPSVQGPKSEPLR